MELKVILHLGAHKTATTYLQSCLSENIEALNKNSIAVLSPIDRDCEQTPSMIKFRESLYSGKMGLRGRRGLRKLLHRKSEFIFSDENIIGRMPPFLSRGFYPVVSERLCFVSQNLNAMPHRIFVSIREYGSFFDSVYAFQTGRIDLPSKSEAIERIYACKRNWFNVVEDIRKTFPTVPIKVWRHEQFDIGSRLAELTENRISALPQSEKVVNRSPTADAMEHLMELKSRGPLNAAQWHYLKLTFRSGEKFSLWNPEQKDAWQAQYEADLAKIRLLKGVELEAQYP